MLYTVSFVRRLSASQQSIGCAAHAAAKAWVRRWAKTHKGTQPDSDKQANHACSTARQSRVRGRFIVIDHCAVPWYQVNR